VHCAGPKRLAHRIPRVHLGSNVARLQRIAASYTGDMNDMRQLDRIDRLLAGLDSGLKTIGGSAAARRTSPGNGQTAQALSPEEAALSGALMRVNHVGEVCAQALYSAQALTTRNPSLQTQLLQAAQEEEDHLAWTAQRLRELDARPSWLNPLWWGGAFGIGLAAGLAGDKWSLGFVVETERQVEAHLAEHLDRLPATDTVSRAVVAQMKVDEATHASWAESAGAHPLPAPIKGLMRLAARVMTGTAHHI
jgi:3-demethoxyubiquinol 3-hydroxylase